MVRCNTSYGHKNDGPIRETESNEVDVQSVGFHSQPVFNYNGALTQNHTANSCVSQENLTPFRTGAERQSFHEHEKSVQNMMQHPSSRDMFNV